MHTTCYVRLAPMTRQLPPACTVSPHVHCPCLSLAAHRSHAWPAHQNTQAARLYAGALEFGGFALAIEQLCREQGVDLGVTSSVLVEQAALLSEEQLR